PLPLFLAFFFLALTSRMAGTVTRSEAVRTAAVRSVTTRAAPRSREAFLSRLPEPPRTVIPRVRSWARRAKRTWLEGATTIDWMGGALRPAPTFSSSDGRPLLTVSPPVIVGSPAIDPVTGACADEPTESVTVMVDVDLPVRLGVPEISPVLAATLSPAGRPVAWKAR